MDNGASSYRRFLEGDDSGLAELVRDYKDGLTLYLNGFVQNIHLAEDLMEDTFFKLMVKKPRFREKDSFKTWLYTIGRNVALDYLRRNAKQTVLSPQEMALCKAEEYDLERAYLTEERKIILHRAMDRLHPEYRQILWLIYFEDFSCKQAAAVMKKKVHTVEVLVSRARKALSEELRKEGYTREDL